MGLILVLGGIRSGKSAFAETRAVREGRPVVYVATGSASDAEMAERIAAHRARRPPAWRTVEAVDPAEALADASGSVVLVDGLSSWLGSRMDALGLFTQAEVEPLGPEGTSARERILADVAAFAEAAGKRPAASIVVADEAGLGGVPLGAGHRRFLDVAGEAAQVLASAAEEVWLVVAGQPLALKQGRAQGVDAGVSLRYHGDVAARGGLLDFAVSVMPGGMHPALSAGLHAGLDDLDRYPDEDEATARLAGLHGREPEEVLLLNGAAEGFWLLAHALRPAVVACVHPSFTEAEAAFRAAGARIERVMLDPESFQLDPAEVGEWAEIVTIGHPNNPTGTLANPLALAALAHPGRLLVVDEAFMDLVADQSASLADRCPLPGVVVLRSITKALGIPGVRAGYLLAPPAVVQALRGARQPWGVNVLALAQLKAYAEGVVPLAELAQTVRHRRERLAAGMRRIPGVRVWPGAANFLLLQVPGGPAVRGALERRGIAVRRCDTFPGLTPDHLRVAVRTDEDNDFLVAALAEVLG